MRKLKDRPDSADTLGYYMHQALAKGSGNVISSESNIDVFFGMLREKVDSMIPFQ
jgi:hypothetical protein